jgi:hypothetical protein
MFHIAINSNAFLEEVNVTVQFEEKILRRDDDFPLDVDFLDKPRT